ncbi:hypothetical protein D9758_001599 [Tetrapyrgos nigripes]|uniref:Uncharacterized protein n=1 Tax=Tetrapyrgos nigripes TaxID=182062 RepID=A0A8H5GXU9_9AGAR|nr:hypothetical protein D9758_001599 [Tetrapyrgos nigripes]
MTSFSSPTQHSYSSKKKSSFRAHLFPGSKMQIYRDGGFQAEYDAGGRSSSTSLTSKYPSCTSDDEHLARRVTCQEQPTLAIPGETNGAEAAIGASSVILIRHDSDFGSGAVRRLNRETVGGEVDAREAVTICMGREGDLRGCGFRLAHLIRDRVVGRANDKWSAHCEAGRSCGSECRGVPCGDTKRVTKVGSMYRTGTAGFVWCTSTLSRATSSAEFSTDHFIIAALVTFDNVLLKENQKTYNITSDRILGNTNTVPKTPTQNFSISIRDWFVSNLRQVEDTDLAATRLDIRSPWVNVRVGATGNKKEFWVSA